MLFPVSENGAAINRLLLRPFSGHAISTIRATLNNFCRDTTQPNQIRHRRCEYVFGQKIPSATDNPFLVACRDYIKNHHITINSTMAQITAP